MIKRNFWVTSVILAAFATMAFTGCDSPTGNHNNQPGTDLLGGPGNGGGSQPVGNQPGNGQPRTFTVTFDSDGGSVITAQTGLVSGATATEPTPPTRAWVPPAGLWPSLDWDSLPTTHTFGGWWYEDENWDFNTDYGGK